MTRSELVDDLRSKGQAKVDLIWEEARHKLQVFADEEAEKLAAEGERCTLKAEAAGRAMKRKKAVAAQRRASIIITQAEQDLNDRLYELAVDLLADVWEGSRTDLLKCLMDEVPESDWDKVWVHPDDVAAASEVFPANIITEDPDILGGLIVSSSAGGVTVINTLRKRLEKAWRTLGPEILRTMVKNEQP